MRIISVMIAAAAAFAVFLAGPTTAAQAGGSWNHVHDHFHGRGQAPHGFGHTQTVRRWVYRPHYKHVYRLHSKADPHRYQYRQPHYYPHHNSGHWRPLGAVRQSYHFKQPRYHRRWGCCGPNRKRKHINVWHRRGHFGRHSGHYYGPRPRHGHGHH